jgi:glycosyltransferase involved in cell wall biosynthesis
LKLIFNGGIGARVCAQAACEFTERILVITVAICTWNRAKLLDQTLTHMRQLRVPAGTEWELLVVNNNCTDDTDAVLQRHANQLPLRPLLETKQGLSNARNCAVNAARGDLLIWTDDDVLVDPEWLAAYGKAVEAWPRATFFGGVVQPLFETAPPAWIRRHLDEIGIAFAIRQRGDTDRPLGAQEAPVGANFAIRTEVQRRYPYAPHLGRTGAGLAGTEDTDLIRRLKADGHEGVWLASARVRHFIPADRMTLDYTWKWRRGHGAFWARENPSPPVARLLGAPRWLVWKYLAAYVKMMIYSPLKNRAWFDAFWEAAFMSGMVAQYRTPLGSGTAV